MPVLNLFNNVVQGANTAISSITSVASSAIGIVDPKMGRLLASGLNIGGKAKTAKSLNRFNTPVSFGGLKENQDWRVRISVGEGSQLFYLNNDVGEILGPLKATKGVIFPYTPKIDTVYQSNYQDTDITHTNYSFYSYNKSSVASITISAEFTAQTPEEAQYVLAVIHFFRAAGKMFTGQDKLAGNPPPLLFLDGYGQHYFPHVPCVLTQFSHGMPDDVDYISAPVVNIEQAKKRPVPPGEPDSEFNAGASSVRTKIPTISTMSIVLQPVYSRKSVSEFSTEKFAQGAYLNKGYI